MNASFNTCPNCAQRFHGAYSACPHCGAGLGAGGPEVAPEPPAAPQAPAAPSAFAPPSPFAAIPPTVTWAAGGLVVATALAGFLVMVIFGPVIHALSASRAPAPTGITLAPDNHFVLMKVTGGASPVTVTYSAGSNTIQLNNITLPWQGSLQVSEGTLVQLVGESKSSQGDVTVEILKNDDPNNPVSLKSATSSGPYVVANTSVICCDTD